MLLTQCRNILRPSGATGISRSVVITATRHQSYNSHISAERQRESYQRNIAPPIEERRNINQDYGSKHVSHRDKWADGYCDAYLLSDRIKRLVEQKEIEKALELLRQSSPDVQSTQSWNLVLAHYASQGQWNKAWSIFNEMRKRGQKPNNYTYSLMLRALRFSDSPNQVNEATELLEQISEDIINVFVLNNYYKILAINKKMNMLMETYRKYPQYRDNLTYSMIIYAATQEKNFNLGFEVWGDYVRALESLTNHSSSSSSKREQHQSNEKSSVIRLDSPLFCSIMGLCRKTDRLGQVIYPLHLLAKVMRMLPPEQLFPTSGPMLPLALQHPTAMEAPNTYMLVELLLLCRRYEGILRKQPHMNYLTLYPEDEQGQLSYTLHYLLNFAQVTYPDSKSITITFSSIIQAGSRELARSLYRQLFAPSLPKLDEAVIVTSTNNTSSTALSTTFDTVKVPNNPAQWSPAHPPVRTRYYNFLEEDVSSSRTLLSQDTFILNGKDTTPLVTRDLLCYATLSLIHPTNNERNMSPIELTKFGEKLRVWLNHLISRTFGIEKNERPTFKQVYILMRACRRYMELVPCSKLNTKSSNFFQDSNAIQGSEHAIDRNNVDNHRVQPNKSTKHKGVNMMNAKDTQHILKWQNTHPATQLIYHLRMDTDIEIADWLYWLRQETSLKEPGEIASAAAESVDAVEETAVKNQNDMVESLRMFLEEVRQSKVSDKRTDIHVDLIQWRIGQINKWKSRFRRTFKNSGAPLIKKGLKVAFIPRDSDHPYYRYARHEWGRDSTTTVAAIEKSKIESCKQSTPKDAREQKSVRETKQAVKRTKETVKWEQRSAVTKELNRTISPKKLAAMPAWKIKVSRKKIKSYVKAITR